MKLFKELVKEFELVTVDEKIDKWLEVNNEREYLEFNKFKKLFYTMYSISKTNVTEAILSVLFYCFCLKMSKRGVGILDLRNKYNNIYYEFLNSIELKGFCNSPIGLQQIDFNILTQNFDADGYNSFKEYLFYNYATKNMKFKYFNSLGREPQIFASYGNKIDIVSYCIDTIAENFGSHKSNMKKTNVYKLCFNTNLDEDGLINRFGLERTETLKDLTLIVNVENFNNYIENCETITKEKFLINEAKNELR